MDFTKTLYLNSKDLEIPKTPTKNNEIEDDKSNISIDLKEPEKRDSESQKLSKIEKKLVQSIQKIYLQNEETLRNDTVNLDIDFPRETTTLVSQYPAQYDREIFDYQEADDNDECTIYDVPLNPNVTQNMFLNT